MALQIGYKVLGIEDEDLFEEHRKLLNENASQLVLEGASLQRSHHFVRVLEKYIKDSQDNILLFCGARHNDHISSFMESDESFDFLGDLNILRITTQSHSKFSR